MTVELSPGVRRVVVAVDVERYSRHLNTVQFGMQDRLRTVLRAALSRARVARRRVEFQESGDGQLLVLPPGVDEAQVVPGFLRGLLTALDTDRQICGETPNLRIRVALGQGVVHRGAMGYVGRVVVAVSRLVDADVVRAELRAVADADACLIVSDDLYRDVVMQGYGGFPGDGFRSVHLHTEEKDFTATAWMRAMSVAALGPDAAVVAAAAAAGSLPLSAGTIAVNRVVEEYLSEDDDPAPDGAAPDDPLPDDLLADDPLPDDPDDPLPDDPDDPDDPVDADHDDGDPWV